MLLTKEVEVGLKSQTIKYYEDKGYKIKRYYDEYNKKFSVRKGTKILVRVEDLPDSSHALVDVQCDGCGEILNIEWRNYLKYLRENNKYYCNKCARNQPSYLEKRNKTILSKRKLFFDWCIENNRQDILDRWDYELNSCKPNEIPYGTNKKYYFKCSKGIHKSELKNIKSFTSGENGVMDCKYCNSFAQWGMDNLGENFLEKYWDYEKNKVDPWEISYASSKNIWIKCQEKDYHESYNITCGRFSVQGNRCPFCMRKSGNVHKLDSLGILFPKTLYLWSDKNKKSPYEYSPFSSKEVWWKCPDEKHRDFKRSISASNHYNFRCPECKYSQLEDIISTYFINKNIFYIPQKTFNGLTGLSNGLLSYDFYIPNFNLLIEAQGIQHEKYIPGFHASEKDFEKQKEHDRRKKVYTLANGYNFLEIWYYEKDKIEEILDSTLKSLSKNESSILILQGR